MMGQMTGISKESPGWRCTDTAERCPLRPQLWPRPSRERVQKTGGHLLQDTNVTDRQREEGLQGAAARE